MVLEMMLEHVEMHGLYTEGIYRKSGSANRMKELHQRLETGQSPSISSLKLTDKQLCYGSFIDFSIDAVLLMCLDPHLVCLEDYPIHTVTGLVKQWLRELPDPLLTFTHYSDFLHTVGEEDVPHLRGAAFYNRPSVCWAFRFSIFFICCWVLDC